MRIRYFLANKLQAKYFGLLFTFMAIPCTVSVIYFSFLLFRIKRQLAADGVVNQSFSYVMGEIHPFIILWIPAVFLLLLIWGVLASHRLAGPITRLIRELKEMDEKEDFAHQLFVRKDDDLRPLVDSVNKILEKANQKITKLK